MSDICDIAIVGAGAAGLFAAIFAGRAASPGTRIVALDGAKKLGTKILIAGGGRCNVTHDVVRPDDYASTASSRNAVKKVLKSFTVDDTVAFFAERGVTLKREDTGKLFPTTDRARTVLNALLEACYEVDAKLLTDHRVTAIAADPNGFTLTTSQGPLTARRVILATGGKALPNSGSDGGGYRLAQALGHTVTPTWPALVPLMLPANHWLTRLKGIAVDVELTLAEPTGKVRHRQAGPMLLTHFGLSGPAPMDISRHFQHGFDTTNATPQLVANLVPPHTFDMLETDLLQQSQSHPKRTVIQLFPPHLPDRFAQALLQHAADLDPATPLSQLSKDKRRALVRALTALPLPVVGDRGFDHAEVTAGGVPLNEIELATMHSRHTPGLHLAGEILDVDGRIGGYNFQWAWTTGRLAGLAAATSLAPPTTA